MTVSLKIDKDVFLRSYRVQYKYAILHGDGNCSWEFVPGKWSSGDHVNRTLSIPKERIQQLTGIYHVYLRLTFFCSLFWRISLFSLCYFCCHMFRCCLLAVVLELRRSLLYRVFAHYDFASTEDRRSKWF